MMKTGFVGLTALSAAALLAAMTSTQSVAQTAAPAAAQSVGKTWANPVDIDYKYNFEQTHDGVSYRTGAEPTVVLHQDRYYLFVTQADGYWVSRDLADWTFVEPNRWPLSAACRPAAPESSKTQPCRKTSVTR